jgi:adhesin transport system outer membrane protein
VITADNSGRGGVEGEAALIERALANHPALRRAEADIEAALSEAEKQRAVLWPTLSLQGEHRVYSGNSGIDSSQVFLALQYQPGAGLSAGAQARAAEARAASLRDTLEAIRRDLVDGLRVDHERHRAAQGRVRDVQSTVDASTKILASYRRLFMAGKRSWLDVVNAARELTLAEQSLADLGAILAVGSYRMKLRAGDVSWKQE